MTKQAQQAQITASKPLHHTPYIPFTTGELQLILSIHDKMIEEGRRVESPLYKPFDESLVRHFAEHEATLSVEPSLLGAFSNSAKQTGFVMPYPVFWVPTATSEGMPLLLASDLRAENDDQRTIILQGFMFVRYGMDKGDISSKEAGFPPNVRYGARLYMGEYGKRSISVFEEDEGEDFDAMEFSLLFDDAGRLLFDPFNVKNDRELRKQAEEGEAFAVFHGRDKEKDAAHLPFAPISTTEEIGAGITAQQMEGTTYRRSLHLSMKLMQQVGDICFRVASNLCLFLEYMGADCAMVEAPDPKRHQRAKDDARRLLASCLAHRRKGNDLLAKRHETALRKIRASRVVAVGDDAGKKIRAKDEEIRKIKASNGEEGAGFADLRAPISCHLVRGHGKWQPHGEGRSLRKWIYIVPYFRGVGAFTPKVNILEE